MDLFDPKAPKPRNLFTETHAPAYVAPKRGQKFTQPARRQWVRPGDVWGQQARMQELMRRWRAGEDLEALKRELWPDEYRGER